MTQPNKPGPSWEKHPTVAANEYYAKHEMPIFVDDEPGRQVAIEKAFAAGAKWAQEKAAAPGEESSPYCPECGSCGEIGCCGPRRCRYPTVNAEEVEAMGKVAEDALKERDSARAEAASLRADLAEKNERHCEYCRGNAVDNADTFRAQLAKAVDALDRIAQTDVSENGPTHEWLTGWRNNTKAFAQRILGELKAGRKEG